MRKYLIPVILLVLGTLGPVGGAALGSYLATPRYPGCAYGLADGDEYAANGTLWRCDSGTINAVGVAPRWQLTHTQ